MRRSPASDGYVRLVGTADAAIRLHENELHHPMHFHGAPHLNGAAQDCLTVSLYGTLAFWLYGTMLLAIVAVVMIGF